MYRRLRLRMTAVCAASTGLVLVAMALAFLSQSTGQMEQQAETAYQSNLSAIFSHLQGQPYIDHAWLSRAETSDGLLIRVDVSGREMSYAARNPLRRQMTSLAVETARQDYGFDLSKPPSGTVQPEMVTFRMRAEGREYRSTVAALPGGENWYGVVILKDTGPQRTQIRTLRLTFAAYVLLALAGLSAVAWAFTAWAIRPVRESRQRQNEFISAAGHELRSPLAVIGVTAENLPGAEPEQLDRFAGVIRRECGRMTRLTNDLLGLAGADSGRLSMLLSPTEPETLLLSVCEGFEPLAAEKEISLRVQLPDRPLPRAEWDADRVEQALGILLDNALRHTPPGGRIRCSAVQRRKIICFSVTDSGGGVPDEEKEKIFRRFYRGDASRTDKEHYGLGLSIALEIARLHRGKLTVRDARGGGAEFLLSLPLS